MKINEWEKKNTTRAQKPIRSIQYIRSLHGLTSIFICRNSFVKWKYPEYFNPTSISIVNGRPKESFEIISKKISFAFDSIRSWLFFSCAIISFYSSFKWNFVLASTQPAHHPAESYIVWLFFLSSSWKHTEASFQIKINPSKSYLNSFSFFFDSIFVIWKLHQNI